MALAPPNLSRLYGREASPVFPGEFEFRLTLFAPGRTYRLGTVVEQLSWDETDGPLTGSVTLRRPIADDYDSLPLVIGARVRCEVRWGGGWYSLWDMRVQPFETDLTEGVTDLDLADDLIMLDQGERDWSYRKTKSRPKGWTADEIARDVARRTGLRIGALTKGKHRMRLVRKNATALDVIKAAYAEERDASGTKFVIRMRDGKLEVIPLRRNHVLYVFRDQIEQATVAQRRAARPVTVIVGKGRIGKGAHAKKVHHTEMRPAAVRVLGRRERHKDYGRVDSEAELRRKCRRDLAKALRVHRTATLTVPGIPFVRRGDAMRWRTAERGWQGSTAEVHDRSFVYARGVSHSVTDAGYQTTIDIVQDDPYFADQKRRDREARRKARARRKKAKSS